MIAALRTLGIAARFVSGYLNLADPDDDSITGGNTHAWVQAFVPGPGWVDFDPSSGAIGNENLVRVAVVDEPRAAIPLEGHVHRVRVGPSRHEGRRQSRRRVTPARERHNGTFSPACYWCVEPRSREASEGLS